MARILFIGTRHEARSQMAEAFVNARSDGDITAVSAGLEAGGPHPLAVRVMGELGLAISDRPARTIADCVSERYDLVVTVSSRAAAACPLLPGNPLRVDWNLSDPAAVTGNEELALETFRHCRDEIQRLVGDMMDRGYLAAMLQARRTEGLVLDNIEEAIVAHDLQRRIIHFNRAAQRITGYTWDEVVYKDCHEVFPGNLCGGRCQFQDGQIEIEEVTGEQLDITAKDGSVVHVKRSLRRLLDAAGRTVGAMLALQDITSERLLARRVRETQSFSGIIGKDEKMQEVFDLIRDLANSDVPVLIQGESGTGKELVAAAIHNEGARGGHLFVPVNCGALPESLLESELFGHVRGAFTGAIRDKKGRFELADGGTIFLDEIGDISPAMQVKLLRVLQEGAFERVGSEETQRTDARVISATNKDLSAEIAGGRFREDLYYRLSVVPVWLPPLRERRNDIPLLANHVLRQTLTGARRDPVSIAPETMDIMLSYEWPGNVRELQNWIQFALVKCKGPMIMPEHLPPFRPGAHPRMRSGRRRKLDVDSVRSALRQAGGNKVRAAELLGVSRATLYRFLNEIVDAG